MRRVHSRSAVVVGLLICLLLLVAFDGGGAGSASAAGGLPRSCQMGAWSWRNTPRGGLAGWMDGMGRNHVGHGEH